MQVRPLLPAPNQYNPNLFLIGDEFGLFVIRPRRGKPLRPRSEPRGVLRLRILFLAYSRGSPAIAETPRIVEYLALCG